MENQDALAIEINSGPVTVFLQFEGALEANGDALRMITSSWNQQCERDVIARVVFRSRLEHSMRLGASSNYAGSRFMTSLGMIDIKTYVGDESDVGFTRAVYVWLAEIGICKASQKYVEPNKITLRRRIINWLIDTLLGGPDVATELGILPPQEPLLSEKVASFLNLVRIQGS